MVLMFFLEQRCLTSSVSGLNPPAAAVSGDKLLFLVLPLKSVGLCRKTVTFKMTPRGSWLERRIQTVNRTQPAVIHTHAPPHIFSTQLRYLLGWDASFNPVHRATRAPIKADWDVLRETGSGSLEGNL
ncbi:hypothetical protein AMECASPLE_012526 [Ameca splendens]|uniref:Uncharacterized protein n=1 Tax=Ameca splendens TaxID=208324 RepID=A0ABV0Y1J4_9TELE